MNTYHFYRESPDAGGGASSVPFHGVVAPNLYAGEGVATVLFAVSEGFKRAVSAFNSWRWERTTRNVLAKLDNATLTDIGVARSEIPAVARAAANNPTFTPTRRLRWAV